MISLSQTSQEILFKVNLEHRKAASMTTLERIIVKFYGHSNNVLNALTIPTLIVTIMIAALAVTMPGRDLFWFSVWCASGAFQALGVYCALKIRLKHGTSNE